MKIGIIGNGFVGRATQIFANNYFAQDPYDNNTECFEILPDTACTPAKPKSVMTYSGSIVEASDSSAPAAHQLSVDATLCCDASLASFGFRRTVSRRWGAEPPAKPPLVYRTKFPPLGGGTPGGTPGGPPRRQRERVKMRNGDTGAMKHRNE